jgi:hypothetical protein
MGCALMHGSQTACNCRNARTTCNSRHHILAKGRRFQPGRPYECGRGGERLLRRRDRYWIGTTFDGGHTWASTFKDPKTSSGDRCFGSDPTVVYSVRDSAFYLATLCFFTNPISEVQVWKSTDVD